MAMELISMDYWQVFFDKEEDLRRAKREHLEQIIETLPWVATIDKFQHWIYENPNTLPRAYMVHHAETVPADQLLERLTSADFDFYHSVLISTPLSKEQGDQLAAQPIRSQAQIEISHYDLHKTDLNVTTNRPGILIFLEANYPGWEATVNGSEQEILEVNSVFRGIFLPPGTHTVSYQFRPLTLYWGITLASLSILLAITIILWTKYSRGKIERLQNSEFL